MKYGQLVHYEPMIDVVQLKNSANDDVAKQLIKTYVISDRMADVINSRIIEQLQFQRPVDNKGLFIVGNYGTGKSHLMSVLSAVAENEQMVQYLGNEAVRSAVQEIAGKFVVVRLETESVDPPLREIVMTALEEQLNAKGVQFSFPPFKDIQSNKKSIIEMMGAFHAVFPDKGLLVVVDELLDYLRSQNEADIIFNLGFLRELGEVCTDTRLRFMTGVQEMLFDNPRFQFVGMQLNRVRERYIQVAIEREDVAYVVANRLLQKNSDQKSWIKDHLQKFKPLYDNLGTRLDEFVDMFPIHPDYISVFRQVQITEKRFILRTISENMKQILDQEVDESKPGLLSFDRYWDALVKEPSLRTIPQVRYVQECMKTLMDKVNSALAANKNLPMIQSAFNALAVYRLTTPDLNTPIGLNSVELKDRLFLFVNNMPAMNSKFIIGAIEQGMKEAMQAVSFQYVTKNESNGQFFIDINKVEPVDERIAQRAESLSSGQLNRYYFDILKQVLGLGDTYNSSDAKIWQYEVPWTTHKITRQGYIFFGVPTQRSTTQPDRDFYLYMVQPYGNEFYRDERKSDEAFYQLANIGDALTKAVKTYGAAIEEAATQPTEKKRPYLQRSDEALRDAAKWLRENFLQSMQVTSRGRTKSMTEWQMHIPAQAGPKEMVDVSAAELLKDHFDGIYDGPSYPTFGRARSTLTRSNLADYARSALESIENNILTQNANVILEGLNLLEGEKLNAAKSGYSKWVLEELEKVGNGRVLVRDKLMKTVNALYGVEETTKYRLEPELLIVILMAMIKHGLIELTISGRGDFTSMNCRELLRLSTDDLTHFTHVKKPSDLPLTELVELFALLGIETTWLRPENLTAGVANMCAQANKLVEEIMQASQQVANGIQGWDGPVLDAAMKGQYKLQLDSLKTYLEGLQRYNTPAKLKHFNSTVADIQEQVKNKDLLCRVKDMVQVVQNAMPNALYLEQATQMRPVNDDWSEKARKALIALKQVIQMEQDTAPALQRISSLKDEYIQWYLRSHTEARLTKRQDDRKSALLYGDLIKKLDMLSKVNVLSSSLEPLNRLRNQLAALQLCTALNNDKLQQSPKCTCGYHPLQEPNVNTDMDYYEQEFLSILGKWSAAIVHDLKQPRSKPSIELLSPTDKAIVEGIINAGELPVSVSNGLVTVINQVLQGLDKVKIARTDLAQAFGSGAPLTAQQIRDNVEKLLKEKLNGRDEAGIRLVIG